jgi:hypothetical protein
MERPSKGRAIITDTVVGMEIIIPARRSWGIIIFYCVWLCGWCLGELFALSMIFLAKGGAPVSLFMLVWLTMWTIGGAFAIRTVLWMLIGREIIGIGHGQLTVKRSGALFARERSYDIDEIERIRVQEDTGTGRWGNQRNGFLDLSSSGTIRFDYGMQTVKIGVGLDEAEAYHILERIRERQLLPERSFALLPPATSSLP